MPASPISAAPGGDVPDDFYADGQTAKYISVTAIEDTEAEDAETFEVHLVATSDNSFLNNSTVARVTIADNDEVAPTVGSATLNWTPPTQNEDGSQLTNLAAYRILWSRDGGSFSNSVRINNPSVTRYVVENLAPGTYEFTATAINSAGVESRSSNSITRVVQ